LVLRRGAAGLLIASMILVPGYLLFVKDDDKAPSPADSDLVEAARDPNKAAEVLIEGVADPAQGITVNHPSGWDGSVARGVVRVIGDDGPTAIAITT